MALSDPFHAVKAEVTQNAGAAEALAGRWQQLEGSKSNGEERARLRQQLSDILLGVTADLEDLEETIAVVEKQRSRFRIDDAELASRRSFICSMRALVDSIYRSVDLPASASAGGAGGAVGAAADGMTDDSPPNSERGGSERVGLLGGGASSAKAKPSTGAAQAKSAMVEQAQQMQQMQMEQQDDLLDGLSNVVGRLKDQGHQMNAELEAQKTMLNSLEEQVEGAGAMMGKLKGKLSEMANSKDRGKYCAIMVLSIILVLLIMAVLS